MDEDQRVRGVPASAVRDLLGVSGVQPGQDAAGQDVPVPVPAALQPHEQDVLRAGRRAAGDRVRVADAAHVAHEHVGQAAGHQGQPGDEAAQRVPGPAPDAVRHHPPA